MKYQFKVKNSERGKCLEAFLYSQLGDWSHNRIKKVLDSKSVFVNGKNVFISGWNLKPGDRVLLTPRESDKQHVGEASRYQYIQVVFEDDYLLVTNKPPFIDFDSFVIQVNAYLRRKNRKKVYPYLGQMHRLDRETSGLLIFTKKKIANQVADQFRRRVVKKYYSAVVFGQVQKDHDIIRKHLEKGKFSGGKKAKVVGEDEGKESYTEYWVEERYREATLLRIFLGTGRTHQIRAHMSEMGHPILGDKLYGEDDSSKAIPILKSKSLKRMALHATRIEFYHPISNQRLQLQAPIPQDMEELIDTLRMTS